MGRDSSEHNSSDRKSPEIKAPEIKASNVEVSNGQFMKKKKIMLIVPMLHQGGFERVCVATARLLEPYYEVYIVIFDSKDIAYDIKGLDVIDLHMGVKKDIVSKCINVLKRSYAVRKTKNKLEVHIAYSFGPTANMVNVLSGGSGRKWLGIRSYMDMADEKKMRWFCRKADKVLCCSRIIEEEISEKYHCTKGVTLYNPFDVKDMYAKADAESPRMPWSSKERVIVSMGREDDVKGFWHLIKSFALLHRQIPDARLMIVGDGSFEEYRELAKDLEIGEAVYFTGMKKNPFPYLKMAELYVLSSYNEGFPNALLEAMAFGMPVIATNCMTGPEEILLKEKKPEEENGVIYGEYGVLIPNMSPEKNLDAAVITEEERVLAGEMIKMMEDEAMKARYKEAALIRVKDFTNEKYVENIIQYGGAE